MTKKLSFSFHRIFSIILSISIVIAGICLMAGCLVIYFTGERTYSREIVAEVFSKIAIPVYICLVLTVVDIITALFIKNDSKTQIKAVGSDHILKMLYGKKNINACDGSIANNIAKERRSRNIHAIIRLAVIAVCSIVFLAYALNSDNFHQSEINNSMIRAMWLLIPCLAVSFGYSVFTVYRNEKSIKREIELLKLLPNIENGEGESVCSHRTFNFVTAVRVVILVAGIAVLIYGFVSGGTADVLTKAINICTECIGLG